MASTDEVLPVPSHEPLTLKHNAKTFGNVRSVVEGHERKSLQTLQKSALDENALVGVGLSHAGTNSKPGEKMKIKQVHGPVKIFPAHSTPKLVRNDPKAASTHNTATQTDDSLLEDLIEERLAQRSQDVASKRDHSLVDPEEDIAYQLMVKEPVPDSYWEEIAEQRRLALNDTLEENRSLHEEMDSLREENDKLSELASHAASLSSLLQSVVSDDESNENDNDQVDSDNLSSLASSQCDHVDTTEALENNVHEIHSQEPEDQRHPEETECSTNAENILAPHLNSIAKETDSTVNS